MANPPKKITVDIQKFVPGHSVDCVVIGFEAGELKVLVLKWKFIDYWTLPGGFVEIDEHLNAAAKKILKERTGLELPYLDQFYTFGNLERRNEEVVHQLFNNVPQLNEEFITWISQRFISTAFLSLVDIRKCKIQSNPAAEAYEWKSINDLPDLIFDHNEMVHMALEKLKKHIDYMPIGINLLPKKFLMKDLQCLYEALLGKELDRSNFQKKMLKLDILIRREKKMDGGAHKAPYFYSFDKKKYEKSLQDGIGFMN